MNRWSKWKYSSKLREENREKNMGGKPRSPEKPKNRQRESDPTKKTIKERRTKYANYAKDYCSYANIHCVNAQNYIWGKIKPSLCNCNFWIAVGTCALAVLAYFTLRSAEKIANKQIAVERAWVDTQALPPGVIVFDGRVGAEITIMDQVNNAGHSAASSVAIHNHLWPYIPTSGQSKIYTPTQFPFTCSDKAWKVGIGTIVLPNIPNNMGPYTLKTDWATMQPFIRNSRIGLIIASCVIYLSPPTGNKLHHTISFYMINAYSPYGAFIPIGVGRQIPISLQRLPIGATD